MWSRVRGGFGELDGRIHDAAGRLRRAADLIEDGQRSYDHALEVAGVATALGIGLTVFTAGLSDVAAGSAGAGVAATASAIVADLELGLSRVGALLAETADGLNGLVGRFAVDFAIRAPELAYGPAGGAALGVGFALASGVRDPGDLAASGLVGALDGAAGPRSGGENDLLDAAGVGSTTLYAGRGEARLALAGALRAAANRFFRDATLKSKDFAVTALDGGGQRFQFFTPARNPGFGKRYVQEVDNAGVLVREYKDTLGPHGLIERKWLHEAPTSDGG